MSSSIKFVKCLLLKETSARIVNLKTTEIKVKLNREMYIKTLKLNEIKIEIKQNNTKGKWI